MGTNVNLFSPRDWFSTVVTSFFFYNRESTHWNLFSLCCLQHRSRQSADRESMLRAAHGVCSRGWAMRNLPACNSLATITECASQLLSTFALTSASPIGGGSRWLLNIAAKPGKLSTAIWLRCKKSWKSAYRVPNVSYRNVHVTIHA